MAEASPELRPQDSLALTVLTLPLPGNTDRPPLHTQPQLMPLSSGLPLGHFEHYAGLCVDIVLSASLPRLLARDHVLLAPFLAQARHLPKDG